MRLLLCLSLLCCAASPVLTVKSGGTFRGGPYASVVVNNPTTQPVVLDGLQLVGPGDLVTVNQCNADLSVTNCVGSTNAPNHFMLIWDGANVTIDHNWADGTGGILVWGKKGHMKSVKLRCNGGHNITGATGATTRNKTSFIQLQYIHTPNSEVAYNYLRNDPGVSAVEDAISLMQAGGTAASIMLVHDNLIDGVFMYPRAPILQFSGSGLMAFDPGLAFHVTVGGYTRVYDNFLVDVEHHGLDLAGGRYVELDHNTIVNDGLRTLRVDYGAGSFNWDNRSDGVTGINIHDNVAYVLGAGMKQHNYSWQMVNQAANNTSVPMTGDDVRGAWQQKMLASGVVIGPVSASVPITSATNMFDAIDYASASAGIQKVPLPSERLGPATAIGYTKDKAWVQYPAVNFGAVGLNVFTASIACINPQAGHTLELHVDAANGPLIGTLTVAGTGTDSGAWYRYSPQKTTISGATGVHDLYLVFNAGGTKDAVGNLASFTFSQQKLPTTLP